MKTTALYSSLTMPQRLRAMASAFGRSDQPELERLTDTSPDGRCSVPRVKLRFNHLKHLAALHNSLLLEPCAVWLFVQTFSLEEAHSLSAAESKALETSLAESLAKAATIQVAFTARVTGAGITAADWQAFRERFLSDGSKHLLRDFLSKAAGCENPGLVAQYHEAIEGYLFKDAA